MFILDNLDQILELSKRLNPDKEVMYNILSNFNINNFLEWFIQPNLSLFSYLPFDLKR